MSEIAMQVLEGAYGILVQRMLGRLIGGEAKC